jgi:hypothetical protein
LFKDEALVETSLSLEATLASGDAKLPFRLPSLELIVEKLIFWL